ncbi:MAG: hypothetical protein HKO65_14235, partial [Gemmatimonadetes bacterium]|nr:hypothetical protein [Gemmatimonadota bacterium]
MPSSGLSTSSRRRRPGSFRARPATVAALLLFTAILPAPPLGAQDTMSWEPFTTIGYGGLGGIVGYLGAAEAARQTDGVAPIGVITGLVGCAIGGRLGLALGREADEI